MKSSTLLKGVKHFFFELISLKHGQENDIKTINEISNNVTFRGANLWILIFAILIASVGLNINSTAVIIGAMLISPLMGPIMGIGLGIGINDFDLIKKSVKNLSIAVFISVFTSALYFFVTPLDDAQSELLSRTTPTFFDVLIAFFGGLAGIVAGSRKEKTNAIPGVAIATALMPPLCTAGYGIATLNWHYFIGATYLFFINTLLISFATFSIVRYLQYPKKAFIDKQREKRVKLYIGVFVFIFILPSIYILYNIRQKSVFQENAKNYIQQEWQFKNTRIFDVQYIYDRTSPIIDLSLLGNVISDEVLTLARSKLTKYGLENTQINIHQIGDNKQQVDINTAKMNEMVKKEVLQQLYKDNQTLIKSKDERIAALESEIVKYKIKDFPVVDIGKELKVLYPEISDFSASMDRIVELDSMNCIHQCIVFIKYRKSITPQKKQQLKQWLKARLKVDKITLLGDQS